MDIAQDDFWAIVSEGLIPVYCLKTAEKYWLLEKLNCIAISVMEYRPEDRRCLARSIFFRMIYCAGGVPTSFLKRALKRDSERLVLSANSGKGIISNKC